MFKNFFSVIFPVVLIVDILIVFFLNMDLLSLIVVFLVSVIFLLSFSTCYFRNKIAKKEQSDCDFKREADNATEKATLIILFFIVICIDLFAIHHLFYRNECLSQNNNFFSLNSKCEKRSDLLASYIESKLNDNEKYFFKNNMYIVNKRIQSDTYEVAFEDRLYFYDKFGGRICLLSINSSICKYWLDRVVDEVKQQTADQTEEKASYLNKVEQEKQVLEKFKENNNLPASIKN